jgi:uncharacterized protein YqgC (DUF456 family)
VSESVVVAVTLLAMLIGIVGVLVPVLPGVVLIGVAGIAATFVLGIDAGGWVLVAVLAVITVVGAGASYLLPARRGLRGNAARSSLGVALVAAIAGFVVVPVVGLPLGAVVGLFTAELRRTGDRTAAWATTRSVLAGYGIGVIVELAAGLTLVALWLVTTLVRL